MNKTEKTQAIEALVEKLNTKCSPLTESEIENFH